jgi:carboxypeptidase family protein
MTSRSLTNKLNPDGDEGSERNSHQRGTFEKERTQQQIQKMSQIMKLTAIILLSTVAAFAGDFPSQGSPLRTVHGTVVDAKGKTVAASVVYLHNEQTHAVRTYVAGQHGLYRFSGIRFYTDYRIHAEHKGLISAVRLISAQNTTKLIKLDLKIDKERPVSKSFVDTDSLTALATEPNDRSSKRVRLHATTAGVSSA